MIRVFLAIDLPGSLQNGLTQVQEFLKQCGADVRWVPVGNIHLTVKFFGNIKESDAEAIEAAAMAVAQKVQPFELHISGAGAFPSIKNPRVVWLGISGQTETLAKLYQGLEQAFATLGYIPEDRPFNAHLTLGRVRRKASRSDAAQVGEIVASTTVELLAEVPAESFALIRSVLKPSGAEYTTLEEFPLRGGNS